LVIVRAVSAPLPAAATSHEGLDARDEVDAFCDDVARHELFAGGGPVAVARAPGRLDLLGGIADYSGGLVLALPIAGMCLRMMRHTMREALDEDYMRTAHGKGLRPRTAVRRHAMPVGAGPVISLAGVSMATIVTNAILIERTFNVPGVLRLTTVAMGSIEGKGAVDYPLLMGIVITGGMFVALGSLVADALHAWLDPRVRA
jgi:ABC-type microcin C transport system permease subunit YejB